ncbi:MAG TPA: hypothetical protein VL974_10860 [Magnetospirillum sp.]|jgi:hypothetical protein|nr:hypothetical protein [Magnetospirillum sp.]
MGMRSSGKKTGDKRQDFQDSERVDGAIGTQVLPSVVDQPQQVALNRSGIDRRLICGYTPEIRGAGRTTHLAHIVHPQDVEGLVAVGTPIQQETLMDRTGGHE